jgi:Fe-S cluster assembly protein SufB
MEEERKMALDTDQVQLDVREGVDRETVETVQNMGAYKYGWETEIETEYAPIGVNEDIVRLISSKNGEPEWMTEWRLQAFRRWQGMEEPRWAMLNYPEIDYQDQYYYAKPKSMAEKPKSLDDVDPKLLATYAKLGIPLKEQMILAGVEGAEGAPSEARKVAVDAVFDSVSLGTTFKAELAKAGVIFCSISEAIREHPELVKKYLGSVVPQSDNFFATLNSAVFSDGSFVYIPPGVRCPMELSTYFRINAENTGQFERTLIIADKGSYVSYLEGCTAPKRDTAQLHAAVVELVILEDAEIKYSTVQNWFPGDEEGKGGIYNFVTKRADCRGRPGQGDVDAGRNRLGDHLEIPVLHPARRRVPGRVLFDRHRQQHAAGRHRDQDDPSWQEHPLAHCFQRDFGGQGAEHLSRSGVDAPQGQEQPQLYPVRQPADRRQVRGAYRALYRGEEQFLAGRARGDDIEGR